MKIKKFRIQNYRSIVDSGDCYPTSTVTILAGKNESGKSSVLQALADFDTNGTISATAKPIGGLGDPAISVCFFVPKHDIESMLREAKVSVDIDIPDNIECQLTKIFGDNYSLESDLLPHLRPIGSEEESNEILVSKLETTFLDYVPNFILFSSFDDVFPNEIPLPDLTKNKWILDLQEISDIDVSTIIGADQRAKKSHKHELNVRINEDFGRFWTQDLSKLSIDWDNEKLYFWIEESGQFYEPEIRSQGRRWHLAFFIRVSARARENIRNVILIDEPGLYLHANAQRDVLKNLDAAAKENVQVIFSTHSPYLIEPDNLDRVRLVRKHEETGTRIENKLHAVGDKETLTPILTAIGLELNRGLVATARINNVVVEGPSDYFYLTALLKLLKPSEINFVSGGSSGNMPKVGTILQGWGCKVMYLYDDDQAYRDATKNIRKEWLTITKKMLAKIPVEGAIEDLFSRDDFAKFVLNCLPNDMLGSNSDFVKGKDKVLASRQFLNRVCSSPDDITLSDETISNANALISELKAKFEEYEF